MQTNNKLREALTQILNLTNSLDENCAVDPVEIRDIARSALAEPVRNCDVGTVDEQIARFDAECLAVRKRNTVEPCAGCPCSSNGEGTEDCQLRWAQMPYEEGGDK